MVEEECRRFRPTKNYLDHLPPLNTTAFETKLMQQEFERIQARLPMETLSMKRYELPPPTAGKLSEISAWQDAVENSMAQLEHQYVRAMNLELMLDYGIESWKAYLEMFVALQAKAQTQLQHLKKQIQDINWKRKQAQTDAGEKLKNLEANWVLLVSKNYEIEQMCAELEKQVAELKCRVLEMEQKKAKEEETDNIQTNGDAPPLESNIENQNNENSNGNEAEENVEE